MGGLFVVAGPTSGALAATTLGQVSPAEAEGYCPGGNAVVQSGLGSGSPYVIPAGGGVLTSYRIRALSQETDQEVVSLKVLSETSEGEFAVRATTPLALLARGAVNNVPVRVPVAGGELIGYYFATNSNCVFPGQSGDKVASIASATDPQPGTTITADGGYAGRVNLAATLEPDVDRDGYGDETQDGCPANASVQATCPVLANPGVGQGGTNDTSASSTDTVKPTLGSLGFSSTVFKAAKSGASIAARKAKVGTNITYRLSEAARVTFTVERETSGRKSGKRCGAKTKKNAKKRKCTRWVKVRGSFTHSGKPGKNTFTFRGRVGGKTLKPGSYRLTSQASDTARNKSPLKRKQFRIVK